MKKSIWIRAGWLFVMALLLSSCVLKSSKQITRDLWQGWEESDLLMQPNYPNAVPVLLVHGWNGDETTWPDAKRLQALERRLGRDIYFFNYRTGALPNRYPPLEAMEEYLELYLKSFPVVDVVAHSMGGLLVRQYLSHHGKSNIRRLLLLSVPNYGANGASALAELAAVLPTGNVQAQEIQPGSDFLWQLNSLDGSELDGIDVLNAYTTSNSELSGDMVVNPVSAWLPWVPNVTVEGDHHTLPLELDRIPFIEDFLQKGVIPAQLAVKPTRRDMWIRIKRHDGTMLRFTDTSVQRRYTKAGNWKSGKLDICCQQRSSMYDQGTTTLIAEKVHAGESLRFMDRSLSPVRVIQIDVPDTLEMPVTMIETTLADAQSIEPAPASEPVPVPAPVSENSAPVTVDQALPR